MRCWLLRLLIERSENVLNNARTKRTHCPGHGQHSLKARERLFCIDLAHTHIAIGRIANTCDAQYTQNIYKNRNALNKNNQLRSAELHAGRYTESHRRACGGTQVTSVGKTTNMLLASSKFNGGTSERICFVCLLIARFKSDCIDFHSSWSTRPAFKSRSW